MDVTQLILAWGYQKMSDNDNNNNNNDNNDNW